jgi:hypothetical protein
MATFTRAPQLRCLGLVMSHVLAKSGQRYRVVRILADRCVGSLGALVIGTPTFYQQDRRSVMPLCCPGQNWVPQRRTGLEGTARPPMCNYGYYSCALRLAE